MERLGDDGGVGEVVGKDLAGFRGRREVFAFSGFQISKIGGV
jgi:hypothetical protein